MKKQGINIAAALVALSPIHQHQYFRVFTLYKESQEIIANYSPLARGVSLKETFINTKRTILLLTVFFPCRDVKGPCRVHCVNKECELWQWLVLFGD